MKTVAVRDSRRIVPAGKTRGTSVCLGLVIATAIAHICALTLCPAEIQASNIVQLLAAVMVVAICLLLARRTADAYLRSGWLQLSAAFAIYTAAQSYFAWSLFWRHASPRFPSPADFLWMMFAFPILLVLVKRRSGARWQWVDWLDAAQACTFFSLLYILVFSHLAAFSVSLAYELQSVALILAWAIRYAGTDPGQEQRFFRDIGVFLIAYGILSSIGNRWEQYRLPDHGWVGLCWSAPLLLFSTLALRTARRGTRGLPDRGHITLSLPKHFHGLSALGLSVMSIAAAATLALHGSFAGTLALATAFLIFAVRTSIRETQLHMAHTTMEHAVMHDPLTGLANRTRLIQELTRRLSASSASPSDTGVLFIDLDRFKIINDSLGHEFGDRLLVEVAGTLLKEVRTEDMVARLGGDEFVILLSSVCPDQAHSLANRVVQRFREPIHLEGRVLHVSVSVGFTVGKPGIGAEDFLRDADCAMYAAKKQGKDQAQAFGDGVVDMAEEYFRLETELRGALASDELLVHYQPIYSLAGRNVIGFEALVRWQHPVRGLIAPADFIPVAEDTGLIIELGRQVLRKACLQTQRWNQGSDRLFSISVNVSARQFADPTLLADIRTILDETGLPPSLLKLEITESVLLSGGDGVAQILREARGLGIAVSLDDFLTGYSSLSYLLKYTCDVVKLDRSFVHAMDKDVRRAELVRTAVQLAKNLDMAVIAEGVETEEELIRLEEMGCDLIQGYLISKPIPAERVQEQLAAIGTLNFINEERWYPAHGRRVLQVGAANC